MEFRTFKELLEMAEESKSSLGDLSLSAEMTRSDASREEILARMEQILTIMEEAASLGLSSLEKSPSGLTGGDAVKMSQASHRVLDPLVSDSVAIALAVNEESAAMGRIVAAPTAGSCGIVPGALLSFAKHREIPRDKVIMGLFTTAVVGQIIEHNACVSGAEGGCQAECGSAAAMAAAAVVEMAGGTPQEAIEAATLAIKNLLGLACDPVAGLVEVPCVKRNGILAGFALIAAEMGLAGIRSAIPPDEVIQAMYQIGRSLPVSLRETAEGGLAVTPTGKEWMKKMMNG
ncbi:MAG: L-serine ammonia-lyase, iron-sulfur-dependent, subunit alpha [Negativicutes bacterium]|nr:L-serine ammonia-lyase, iron-sulfur-dependent, subunit alpha [Negativicutes bacterium]